MNKSLLILKKYQTIFMILLFFLLTTGMQASENFMAASHLYQSTLFIIFIFSYLSLCYFFYESNKINLEDKIFLMTLGGVIIRSFYILFTSVYDRQHDAGTFTSLSDELINIGHLGYIEFLCKFGHIPEFSPYEIFSYYHPPVHHILASLFIHLQLLVGVTEKLAFENIQALTGLYSALCLPVSYAIFKKLHIKEGNICLAYALICFHPGMIYMSASVNNDMLCTLMTFLCFYFGLCWIEDKSFKNLMKISLTLGLGMITKLNCAVMAFPLAAIFLYYIFQTLKTKGILHSKELPKIILEFLFFGITTASIGLSWVVRNLVKFGDQPGVPVATETSFLYTGNYSFWELFGFPSDLQIDQPFHNIHASELWNSWLILFRTSIFSEVNPPELPDIMFILCQLSIILAMILGLTLFIITIIMEIREIKKGDKELGIYLFTAYIFVIITFIAFIIKYPFTCSADFRYVVIGLVLNAIAYLQFSDTTKSSANIRKLILQLLNYLLTFFLILITAIFILWNQW